MKNTLKNRLIALMIISSVFLIATFTAIQVFNQLQRSSEFSLYRANLGAFVTKDRLQYLFSDPNIAPTAENYITRIKDILSSELDSQIIEGGVLFNKDATRLVSAGSIDETSTYDKTSLYEIYRVKNQNKWLVPFINKKNRIANLFIVLENPYGFLIQLSFSLGNISQALKDVYVPVMFTITIVIIGNIILGFLLSRALISPIKTLNAATKDIAAGDLDRKVYIKTEDELEELATTFNYMTVELKKMKEIAENANPLTKLPGNIVIREQVEKRMKGKEKFVLIYSDLDNFKAFNDKYGVHAGDEAIMFTAQVFKDSIAKVGAADDFIGHEGGDDFLLLTTPERVDKIADCITKEFDKSVIKFYSKEDMERGYIEGKSRETGEPVRFPIMTISLAGVSNVRTEITSYAQMTNIAAELKKVAKKIKGKSKFVMDMRSEDLGVERRGHG